MKRLIVKTAFVVFLLSTKSYAQSGAVIPPADAGHASQISCVILQRMGRVDRTKSRLSSLGISGKRFRYIEGELPEGFSLQGKMTDHDVRNLQAQGATVIVVDSHYTSEDLQEARASCRGETSKTPTLAEAKALPAPESGAIANTAATTPRVLTLKVPTPEPPAPKKDDSSSSMGTTDAALLDVTSTPTEADVYVDEHLSGRTPSTLILMPGNHEVIIKKLGFVVWQRKFRLPSGRTSVDAELLPKAK